MLFRMFSSLLRAFRSGSRPLPRRNHTAQLSLEQLESRDVPAFLFGPTAQGVLSGATTYSPDLAMDSNGSRVVVAWTDQTSASTAVVKARVMSTTGTFLTDPITVTASPLPWSAGRPIRVDVAIDAEGRFAVAYDGLPNATGQADIGIQRYNADGTAYGSVFVQGLANRLEINPAIDLADNGRIVVAYDQVATTTTPMTHRLTVTAYASFTNMASNTTTSISSVGGEIYPDVAFNAAGQYLLSGTTLTTQASTPFRVFSPQGNLTPSTTLRSDVLQPATVQSIPGSNNWQLVYLDVVGGVSQVLTRVIEPGATQSTAPVLGSAVVLATNVQIDASPAFAVDSAGNLAVAYRTGATPETSTLMVGFYDAAGAALMPAQTVSAAASSSFALARGANVLTSMATFTAQTEFDATNGSLVDFDLRGMVFGTTNVLPAEVTVRRNGSLPFTNGNSISVTNVDAGHSIRVELSVSVGKVSVGSRAGVVVVGNQTGTLVLTGNAAAVNQLLSTLTYQAEQGWVGTAILRMKSQNRTFGTDSPITENTANIQVINTPPTAPMTGLAYRALSGATMNIPAANGLVRGARDADGDALSVRVQTGPRVGQLVLRPDGSFLYQPPAGFLGRVTFTVVYSDGVGFSGPVTITIDVIPAPLVFSPLFRR